jgi:hypothetical protein
MTEVNALVSLVSLLFIIIMAYWFYQGYRVDLFRQRVFKLRDELFDYAVDGHISFEDDSYKLMRTIMNGGIRYAHRLDFIHSIMLVGPGRPLNKEQSFTARFDLALKTLDDEQKAHFEDIKLKFNFIVLQHMVMRSPLILVTLLLPITFVLMAKGHIDTLMRWFRKPIRKMDSIVMREGNGIIC